MHRILIVEDDRVIRKVLRVLFETNGFRALAADTCELGVSEARTHRPDVCIVDLGLPDSNGIHFIRKIRQWSPVAIIVLSARVTEPQRLAAFEAGADDDYVTKAFSSLELLARVRAIMRRIMRNKQPERC
jgi:two-component system, OmpR family, KDP operon response regulator KdpE